MSSDNSEYSSLWSSFLLDLVSHLFPHFIPHLKNDVYILSILGTGVTMTALLTPSKEGIDLSAF